MILEKLTNKTALITGAGRGIGRAISLALAREGARLILISRTLKELEETKKLAEASGVPVFVFPVDVSSPQAVLGLFTKLKSILVEGLDFLINNAGFADKLRNVEVTDEEIWEKTVNINLSGVYRMTRSAIPFLRKRGSAAIVNISSVAGTAGFEKFSGLGAYTAAKSGVTALGEVLAGELKSDGIRVYTVSPGAVNTAMLHGLLPAFKAGLEPDDIAGKVVDILKGKVHEPSGSNIVVAK